MFVHTACAPRLASRIQIYILWLGFCQYFHRSPCGATANRRIWMATMRPCDEQYVQLRWLSVVLTCNRPNRRARSSSRI